MLFALGEVFDSGRSRGLTICWDLTTGKQILREEIPFEVGPRTFSSDGALLLYGDGRVVESRGQKLVSNLNIFVDHDNDLATFSPDHNLIAVTQCYPPASTKGNSRVIKEVQIHESSTGRMVSRIPLVGHYRHLVLSNDGRCLFAADTNTIIMWETLTGQEIRRFNTITAETSYSCNWDFLASSLAVSPDGRTLASGAKDTTILLWDMWATSFVHNHHLSEAELNKAWSILGSENANQAYTTIGDLTSDPESTVRWLRNRLKPVSKIASDKVKGLIGALNSSDFQQRDAAQKKLTECPELYESSLREALNLAPPLEQRRRLERILQEAVKSDTPKALRDSRLIQVLERLDTPESQQHLRALAAGATEARLTRMAKGAIARIDQIAGVRRNP